MASIQKTDKGWRAQVKRKGVRDSQVFSTKRDAQAWANARELEIAKGASNLPDRTVHEAFERYAREVSPKHKGELWEVKIFRALPARGFPMQKMVWHVTPSDIAEYRDARLRSVKPGTVLRELKLINAVFAVAKHEWGWVSENPCSNVSKPASPPHRERTLRWWEIKRLLREMGYRPRGGPVTNKSQSLAIMLLLALRTGMRSGELCGLTWGRVRDRHVYLPETKNGKAREVPLSIKATRLLHKMRGWDGESVFNLADASRDALFRKYKVKAGLSGLTFHDTRHTAATWMASKVDALTLCKIFGWSSTKFALIYYNPSVNDIASLLD